MFFNKHAIVIGPTPPGTGEIALTLSFTSLKLTSPTILLSTLFIQTSIIIESFLTQSPFIKFALPTAATIISAFLHSPFKSLVFE